MIQGMNHFTVLAQDEDKTLDYYVGLLGLQVGTRPDLGFHGAARRAGDRTAPVYQLHLGGGVDHRGARFGRQVIKVPARRVPEAVARMLTLYEGERVGDESPAAFYERVESSRVSALLQDLAALDAQTADEVFLDIGESVGFRVAIGEGDCAA